METNTIHDWKPYDRGPNDKGGICMLSVEDGSVPVLQIMREANSMMLRFFDATITTADGWTIIDCPAMSLGNWDHMQETDIIEQIT